MDARRIALVTDELKRLIPCRALPFHLSSCVPSKSPGVPPARLSYKFPELHALLAQGTENMSAPAVGDVMEANLRKAIEGLQTPFRFRIGKTLNTLQLKVGFLILLGMNYGAGSADDRRNEVIYTVLGGGWDAGGWRKPCGPEREVLKHLAIAIIEQFGEVAEEELDIA